MYWGNVLLRTFVSKETGFCIFVKLVTLKCTAHHVFVFLYIYIVTHVLPLSPGQSQILNWNALLPHILISLLKYREIWESGKRKKEDFHF